MGVERVLCIHLLQHWFNLSDPAAEEALYDSRALREFAGIDLGREPVPDETTQRLFVACALSNLVMVKKQLLKRRRVKLRPSCA